MDPELLLQRTGQVVAEDTQMGQDRDTRNGPGVSKGQARTTLRLGRHQQKEIEECCHHAGGAISEVARTQVGREGRGYLLELESSRTCRI